MEVEANGKTFEFPDGTPPELIGDAIDEYFASLGGQSSTAAQMAQQEPAQAGFDAGFGDALADTGKGILGAGINLANIPAELHDAIVSAGAWAGGKLGVGDGTYQPAPRLTQGTIEELTGADKGSLSPEMLGGKILAEVLPYFAGGVGKLGTKGATEAEKIAQRVAQIVSENAGGVGRTEKIAQGTARLAKENAVGALAGTSGTDTDAGDFAERLGVDMALGGAANAIFKGIGKGVSKLRGTASTEPTVALTQDAIEQNLREASTQRKPELASTLEGLSVNPEKDVVAAAERLGVADELLPSHFSGNEQYVAVEQALKSRVGSSLSVQENSAISSLAKKAGEMIDEVSGAPDALAMGSRFEENLNRNMHALERRSDALFKNVDANISPRMQVNASNTEDMVNGLADDLGGWENLSPVEKQVFKAVNPDPQSGSVLTYAYLNRQRRMIGAALQKNQGPYKDADRAVLRQLYGSLSQDIRNAIPEGSVRRNFEVATRLVAMRKGLEERSINLLGKTLNGDVVYKASNSLRTMQKGDGKAFRDMVANIPSRQMRQEIFATALRDMLSSGKRGADFNPGGFADWWQNMQASGQLRQLAKVLPREMMTGLADVYTVARGIQKAKSKEIATGRLKEFTDRFDKVTGLANVIDKYSGVIAGAAGSAGGTVGRMTAGAIAEKIASMARKAGGAESSAAADALISSPAFREAAKTARNGHLSEADRIIRRSAEWQRFYEQLSDNQKRAINRVGIMGLWHGSDEKKERSVNYNDLTPDERQRLRDVGMERFLNEKFGY